MSASHHQPTPAELAAAGIFPPTPAGITLFATDLFFASLLLPVTGYIAWKHGKAGMMCWPTLVTNILLRMVGDIDLLVTRDLPLIPSVVTGVTNVGVIACVALVIFGAIYMSNIVLPTPGKNKQDFWILMAFQLVNTVGAVLGFLPNQGLAQLGNDILFLMLFSACVWMVPTYLKVRRYTATQHPNAATAKYFLYAAAAATPFWMVRIGASTVQAYTADRTLDPIMGSFATKFVFGFWMWLAATTALTVGGWLSMKKVPPTDATKVEYVGREQDPEGTWDGDRRKVNRERRAVMYGDGVEDGDQLPVFHESMMGKETLTPSTYATSNSLHNQNSYRPQRPKPPQQSPFSMGGEISPLPPVSTSTRTPRGDDIRAGDLGMSGSSWPMPKGGHGAI